MTKQKINRIVGSIGAFIGIIVFIAYIPQIIANLQGNKAQPFQPLSAAISCLIWLIYGWTKEPKKDWILIIPNSAGVILGGITFFDFTLTNLIVYIKSWEKFLSFFYILRHSSYLYSLIAAFPLTIVLVVIN